MEHKLGLINIKEVVANNPDYGVLSGNFMSHTIHGDYCDIAFHGNVANSGTTTLLQLIQFMVYIWWVSSRITLTHFPYKY